MNWMSAAVVFFGLQVCTMLCSSLVSRSVLCCVIPWSLGLYCAV